MAFFFSFIFGTIIGSFINVLVLRYGAKKLSGRSACFSCGKMLHWYELIPVCSFFAQRGRCRGCNVTISWQYPVVELVTGVVFTCVFLKFFTSGVFSTQISNFQFPISNAIGVGTILVFILHLLLWSLLISILVYDLRHKIIPDALVYSAILLSVLIFLTSYFILHTSSPLDFWGSFLLSLPFAALWFFSRGRAIGLGDAKLIFLFSPLLGFAQGVSAVLLGFWLGASVALAAILLKGVVSLAPHGTFLSLKSGFKRLTMKTELPLAPFLIAGLFLVYLFGWDVTGLSLLLQGHY